jgi:putative intracellular protease/amidase
VSPLQVTFVDEPRVHELLRSFYEARKLTAIVCHSTSVLLRATLSDGSLLVAGKTWTGFTDSEEDYADEFVGQRMQPFRIEQEAGRLEGTNFVVNSRFKPFAVRDGLLVTGQQQYSGGAAAKLVIEALGV